MNMPRPNSGPLSPSENLNPEIFDRSRALAQVYGEEAVLRELLGSFLEDCPGLLASIRFAAECRDCKALEFAAHKLRGSLGCLFALSAFRAAEAVERLSREGRPAEAAQACPVLEREVHRLQEVFLASCASIAA